jgi:uncharacterized membrane protein YecN with MAPEG domain
MTPPVVTALYAALIGLLLLGLSWQVTRHRRRARISLGSGEDAGLERAIRTQANLAEYAPLTLLLIALAELNGAAVWFVHGLGALFVIARVLHAWGLGLSSGVSVGRFWGTALTWLALLAACLGNLWLALIR